MTASAERTKMPEIRKKNNRVKYGLTPSYTPKMLKNPTEEANIPLWQRDGSVKYVTAEGFKWLIDHKKIDMPKPNPVKVDEKEESPPSKK